jgi:uncharacterized membrane protein
MGKTADFLKTTVIGGFFVLLPLVVVIALLVLSVVEVIEAIKPIMEKLSIEGTA